MELFATRRQRYALGFGFAVTAIYVAGILIVRSLTGWDNAGLMATAVTLDLTLMVPLFYYLLIVKGAGARPWTVVPVFLVSLTVAHLVVPPVHQDALGWISLLAIPVELGLMAYIIFVTVRAIRRARQFSDTDIDVLVQLRNACSRLIPGRRLAEVTAHELAALYYGLFSPMGRLKPHPDRFSYHEKSSYGSLLTGLIFIVALEIGIVHLLLLRWQPIVAWVVLALSLYSVLWLVGDYRAMRLRPIVVEKDALVVRLGLRWEARVPLDAIEEVRPPGPPATDRRTTLRAVALGDPNLVLKLSAPQAAFGPFGIRRSVTSIDLAFDELERFEKRLNEALHQGNQKP